MNSFLRSFVTTKNKQFVLVLDAGTTGIKAFVFDRDFKIIAKSYRKISEFSLREGKVEQDPRKIVDVSVDLLKEAVGASGIQASEIAGVGVTNQRETVVAWDKVTSRPLYPAIVWKDSRTKEYCEALAAKNEKQVREKTGLPIESYFSASKINWLLNNIPEVKTNKNLACGTLDSWIIWNISGARSFVTDWTNASRTLLFNIHEREWDQGLFNLFGIPGGIMPEIKESKDSFGVLRKDILGLNLPIMAVCGDQQASMFAAGTEEGVTKITYGTGTFIMQAIGNKFALLDGFFTTLMANGEYAVEAKIGRGGKEVEPLLNDTEKLRGFLKELAVDTDFYLRRLPRKPGQIVIDGGVMRDGIIGKYQEEISGLKMKEQAAFDGTALGVAKLILDGYHSFDGV